MQPCATLATIVVMIFSSEKQKRPTRGRRVFTGWKFCYGKPRMRGMDSGIAALFFGLGSIWLISVLPNRWMRAAGGLLIAVTLAIIAFQLTVLAFS